MAQRVVADGSLARAVTELRDAPGDEVRIGPFTLTLRTGRGSVRIETETFSV